jgi:hypothetical protein
MNIKAVTVQHFLSHKVRVTLNIMPQNVGAYLHMYIYIYIYGCLLLYLRALQLNGEETLNVLRHLETAAVNWDMIKVILF